MIKSRKRIKVLGIIMIILLVVVIGVYIYDLSNREDEGRLVSLQYDEIMEMIENKESFVLVLSQTTCYHCTDYKPTVKSVAREYGIDLYYTDYDKYTKEAREALLNIFNITGSPTTVFVVDGKEKGIFSRLVGEASSKSLVKKLEEFGYIEK